MTTPLPLSFSLWKILHTVNWMSISVREYFAQMETYPFLLKDATFTLGSLLGGGGCLWSRSKPYRMIRTPTVYGHKKLRWGPALHPNFVTVLPNSYRPTASFGTNKGCLYVYLDHHSNQGFPFLWLPLDLSLL